MSYLRPQRKFQRNLPPKVDGLDAVFRCTFPTTPSRVLAASLRALAREDKIMADKTRCHMNPLTVSHNVANTLEPK